MSEVIVVMGAGSIGQAIARRVSAGKHLLLTDLHQGNADAAAEVLGNAGFEVSTAAVDVSSCQSLHTLVETATALGEVTGVIHAAGVSHSKASPEAILAVDLYGTAVLLEEFGNVIAPGGAGVVIASQSGHRLGALTAEQNAALATTPADELLALPMLQPDQVTDSLHAYQLAKRGNSLRVMAEAVRWGKRGARVNTISPGIIFTPLAKDELGGPRGAGYRRMLELSPVGRGGTPDEVATVAALLLGPDGGFITPAATFSWTVASPPPGSSASSPHGDRSRRSSRLLVRAGSLWPGPAAGRAAAVRRERDARRGVAGRRLALPQDFLKRNPSPTVRDERFLAYRCRSKLMSRSRPSGSMNRMVKHGKRSPSGTWPLGAAPQKAN
jgi:NAD(P)-dependent dehydrogenase (short-subunit alcohol dehydrogenase family)